MAYEVFLNEVRLGIVIADNEQLAADRAATLYRLHPSQLRLSPLARAA